MECSTSRRSVTATVHVRRTTCKSVTYSPFVRQPRSNRTAVTTVNGPFRATGGSTRRYPLPKGKTNLIEKRVTTQQLARNMLLAEGNLAMKSGSEDLQFHRRYPC